MASRFCPARAHEMDDWSRGYRDLGRHDLTSEEAKRRVAIFAEAALADAQE